MIAAKTLTPSRHRTSGAPPGPRQRDQRQNALLDAAAALFVEKGVAATSIDDIAVRAGVAKGTFYHYFHDRTTMLEALRRRYSQQFADSAQAAMDACDPCNWQELLAAWVDSVVREYLANYPLHDAIFHETAACNRCVMSEEPIVRNLATLIESGCEAGVWDAEDPLATSVCMFHGLHGLVDEVIAKETDTASLAPSLSRLFGNMLRSG